MITLTPTGKDRKYKMIHDPWKAPDQSLMSSMIKIYLLLIHNESTW